MKNVGIIILKADARGQVCPMSQLILGLYVILIVFLFSLRITPIWATDYVVIVLVGLSPGARPSAEDFTRTIACKPHNSQSLLLLSFL